MEQHYLKQILETLKKNTFWTAVGSVGGISIGILALVIAIFALVK